MSDENPLAPARGCILGFAFCLGIYVLAGDPMKGFFEDVSHMALLLSPFALIVVSVALILCNRGYL